MHSCKTVLVGIIFALVAGLVQAANVVYVTFFDNDFVLKFDADTGAFPNDDLYVASYFGDSIDCCDGQTGDLKRSIFGSGLAGPMDLAFRSR